MDENKMIEILYRKYLKTRDKKYLWVLQKVYGLDCDYIPGYDDGEKPPKAPVFIR
jgi:hypothetical protein